MSDAAAARRAKRERRIRRVVTFGTPLLKLLARTWRFEQHNAAPWHALRREGKPIIWAFWHARMLPLAQHHRDQGVAVLVSEHSDGEIITRVIERFGFRTVRGSTSRGASRALLGMIHEIENGRDVAFTPDGPRGPAESFAPGPLLVAQKTGAAIVLVGAGTRSGWRLGSWDRFLIPKPFASMKVIYSDPMRVDANTPREAAAEAERFGALLRELTARADA
ncbi:MAG TPA: lysophospholipid acyltransferase family protein [Gemmatimonadaceae bacterium]|nr:lysophospholipid acyltransferase family protein [Gemmatimonadaceae bacterium]